MKRSLPIESEQQQTHYSHTSAGKTSPVSQAFVDNRESTAIQRQLMVAMANSPQVIVQRLISQQIHSSPRILAQRKMLSSIPGESVQRVEGEELLQGKVTPPVQRVEEEAPGQEQHLPHEAWHVVQQAQGRVQPTMQMKDGVPVNNDKGLEHEADVMEAKTAMGGVSQSNGPSYLTSLVPRPVVQAMRVKHRGIWFDLDKPDDEIRFMTNPDAYVDAWYMEKVDAIYEELMTRYEFYDKEIENFCTEACAIPHNIPNLVVAMLMLEAKKKAFEQDAQYRHPISMAGLGLNNAQTEQAIAVYRQVVRTFGAHPSTIRVTGSSGAVVTFILTGGDFVVQYYISAEAFALVTGQIGTKLPSHRDQPHGMAHVCEFWNELQAIMLEKVEPIANSTQEEDEQQAIRKNLTQNAYLIYNDILQAILDLHDKGLSQGDVRLDNIGQRYKSGQFVLFDFNMLRKSSKVTLQEDIKNLNNSFIHWGVKVPEMRSELQERVRKLGVK